MKKALTLLAMTFLFLLQRKMKNVYPQNICHVFLVSSNIANHVKSFMDVS